MTNDAIFDCSFKSQKLNPMAHRWQE